jgi:tRNA:m4X modification enzyme
LLSSKTHYIEFGAGRGKLSHWLQLALQGDDSVHFTLVDRANCRRKFDLYHRFESQGPKFERLLIDIEHLDLGLLLKDGGRVTYNQVIGVSKHLCGAATDLALRCLTRYQQSVNGSSSVANMAPAVQGMVMALCCHQRCNWKSMFGREILEDFGFNPVDFHIISHMTSWAVCGQRPDKVDKDDASPSIGYIPHAKEHIGLKCKRFMDLIRVHKLRQCGYDCHLVHYVDRTISLENVLLIAVLKDCSNT